MQKELLMRSPKCFQVLVRVVRFGFKDTNSKLADMGHWVMMCRYSPMEMGGIFGCRQVL
jgi:hypothetical protein